MADGLPRTAGFDLGRASELRRGFEGWRRDWLDRDRIPVRERAYGEDALVPVRRDVPNPARRDVPALGLVAQLTRETGIARQGFLLDRQLDRAVTLALFFFDAAKADPRAEFVEPDPDVVAVACQGVFGAHLDKVWVERPESGPDRFRRLHLFRLFVGEDWLTPVTGRHPGPPHLAWPEWLSRASGEALRRATA